jgi:hypothetical protein
MQGRSSETTVNNGVMFINRDEECVKLEFAGSNRY